MALARCANCNAQISTEAMNCLHCGAPKTELNRRNEPCRRRAFVQDACIVQSPAADPAAAYRHRGAQLISAFRYRRNSSPCSAVLDVTKKRISTKMPSESDVQHCKLTACD